jgi:hypothetical protein
MIFDNGHEQYQSRFKALAISPVLTSARMTLAWRTLQGIETVHMIRKGRVRRLAKGDAAGQVRFIAELFGLAA